MSYLLTINEEVVSSLPLTELMALANLIEVELSGYHDLLKTLKGVKAKAHYQELFDTLAVANEIVQNYIDKRRESYFTIQLPSGENAFEHYPAEEGEEFPFSATA
ncbi:MULTISPECIES: hypothetical protein [unclassified Spirosoma]|uniref:hypothetical protein n=1 Tax=unclassified Spirosoma TaxID=2621999 RepID=UPI00095F394B|nr:MULTISPECIES: hypothetical protein [unclassified Spirosoma]MBN8825105.1 hypothetical protein [Spirosoma sp.]OJW77203.1 MAG: hypothetical protein BGO59_31615 [Spirosoma sp. 48-14]